MSTSDRRAFLARVGAAVALTALEPAAVFAAPVRGRIDPLGRFGSLLNRAEFDRAPRVLAAEILALFASQSGMHGIVKSGAAHRHVLRGLPPVMMQGTVTSLGYPGSCEADSFGYGLGTYTAARGYPGFDPASADDQISAAYLFSWAQHRAGVKTCQGSLALPYLGLLIARGAPSALQVPYKPDCAYIDGLNANIESYSGIGKFAIGSYKTLPNFLNGQSKYLGLFKQYLNAGHAIAFSGLVANGYDNPATAMVKRAYAPASFITGSGHGQLIVRYDDSLGHRGAFLVQNSFGTDWPYLGATHPLMKGRLWWSYESFFASQGFGAVAYPIPAPTVRWGAVTLTSSTSGAPVARVVEAHRADDRGQSFAVFELDFAQPVQLDTIRVTPPHATSAVAGP